MEVDDMELLDVDMAANKKPRPSLLLREHGYDKTHQTRNRGLFKHQTDLLKTSHCHFD